MLKKFLVIFLLFIFINNSFAEANDECRDGYYQNNLNSQRGLLDPPPLRVVGSCVGALGGAVTSMVSQGASGKKDINWGSVGSSAARGALAGFISPTSTIIGVAPAIWGGLIDGASDSLYDKYKNSNKDEKDKK